MKINELLNEIKRLMPDDDFEVRFKNIEGKHQFIIDNVINRIDTEKKMIYLTGYETPF